MNITDNQTSKSKYAFLKALTSSYAVYGINLLLLIIVTPILLNKLGAEQFGIWLLCQNIATYFNLFNLGFLSNMVAQYATNTGDNHQSKNELFSTVFFSLLMFVCVSIPAFWYIHEHFDSLFKISSNNIIEAQNTFKWVYMAFITIFLASTFDMILYYVLGKIVAKNILEIIRLLVLNGGYVAIVLYGRGIEEIAFFYLIVQSILLICYYILTKKNSAALAISIEHFNKNIFKSFFKPSFNFMLLNLANMIIFAGDNIMISALIGVEQIVLFSLSFKLSDISIRLINKIVDVKSPLMIEYIKDKNYVELKKEFTKLITWSVVLSFVAAVIIALFGKMILSFWLQNKYEFDNNVIIAFALFIIINSLYYVCWIFLNLTGKHTKLSYVVFLEIGLNMILSYILSKELGLLGIALGTVLASASTSAWFAYYECYRYFKNLTEDK